MALERGTLCVVSISLHLWSSVRGGMDLRNKASGVPSRFDLYLRQGRNLTAVASSGFASMENNPYAAPASSLLGAAGEGTTTGFRDLSGISRKLSWLLLIGAGLHVLGLISSFMQLSLVTHPPFSVAQANANDFRERLVSSVQLILFLITAIVFGRWIYLAQKNLPELGARSLRFGPGWSLGVFFVPVLNLWAPYQAMGDLAKASRDPRTWQLEDTPVLILVWWIMWLLVSAIGYGLRNVSSNVHTVERLEVVTELEIAYGVLSLLLFLLACYIVRRIWRDQSENFAQIHTDSTTP